jgi:hypothetical protein
MADLLDAAQKQINDAANKVADVPGVPAEPSPEPMAPAAVPLADSAPASDASNPPPLANNSDDITSKILGGAPPMPNLQNPPAAPAGVPLAEAYKPPLPALHEEAPLPPPMSHAVPQVSSSSNVVPPPVKPKKSHKGILIAGVIMLLATLPIAVYYISQQQKQVTTAPAKAGDCWCRGEGESCGGNSQIGNNGCPVTHQACCVPNNNGSCAICTPADAALPAHCDTTTGQWQQCKTVNGKLCWTNNGACNGTNTPVPGNTNCGGVNCASGLVCSKQTNTCVPKGGSCSASQCSYVDGTMPTTAFSTTYYCDAFYCRYASDSGVCSQACDNGITTPVKPAECYDRQIDYYSDAGKGTWVGYRLIRKTRTDCNSTPTPTVTPPVAQCQRIKIYRSAGSGTSIQLIEITDTSTIHIGDQLIFAVVGDANTQRGRIRLNGAAWTVITTATSAGGTPEYRTTSPVAVPATGGNFVIEAEVSRDGTTWQ